MKALVKFAFIFCVLAFSLCYIVFLVFYVKPNNGIKKNRRELTVRELTDGDRHKDSIHFLNTGSSDAIIIESDGHFALIDCGEDTDNPRGFEELVYRGYENEILGYLKQNCRSADGKVHLDFILGTHAHSDHLGGFDTVISDEDVVIDRAYLKRYNEAIIRSHETENWDNKEVYEQTVNALVEKDIPIISDITEREFTLGNFKITLFNTEYDNEHTDIGENDNSIGVLVEKNGKRAFLAADIDNITGDEDRLAPQIGKVDILKVGHHSYSKSTTRNWLKTLNPNVSVVTNNYESTDKRTLRRITGICRCPILVTGSEKGIMAVFEDDGTIGYYSRITDWE